MQMKCFWAGVHSQGPIPCTIPVPGPAGAWVIKLRGSCGSMTLQPQLWSVHWLNNVLVKGVPWSLLLRVKSNLWVRLKYPSWAYYSLRGEKGENISLIPGSAYCDYLYFPPFNYPGAYSLVPFCTCLRPSLQIWSWLWHQYAFTIRLWWECHLVYPIHPPLMYLLLWSYVALADEGISVYAVRTNGLSREVEELVKHFIVTFNYKDSVIEAKPMTYRKGPRAAVAFLNVRGGQHHNVSQKNHTIP